MSFERDHPSLSEGDTPEDALQRNAQLELEMRYELDIPGGVMSCTASQLGLRAGDYANPQYREAYTRVMIIREPDDQRQDGDEPSIILVSVGPGNKSLALLKTYLEKNDGKGLERKFMQEENDGRYVLEVSNKVFQQMRRLGFDILPIERKRREHHERP